MPEPRATEGWLRRQCEKPALTQPQWGSGWQRLPLKSAAAGWKLWPLGLEEIHGELPHRQHGCTGAMCENFHTQEGETSSRWVETRARETPAFVL